MGEKNPKTSIKDVFIQCQTGMQSHGKLISTLTKIYDKVRLETDLLIFYMSHCSLHKKTNKMLRRKQRRRSAVQRKRTKSKCNRYCENINRIFRPP